MFGVFQTAASQGLGTAEIWDSLRTAAGEQLFRAQGAQQPYDPDAVTAAGAQILSQNGINATAVSTFRGVAGQWLGAQQRLAALDEQSQITSSEIFVPPWATTNTSATPDRYRVRAEWQFDTPDGDVATVWKTDEVQTPLTNTTDLLGQIAVDPVIDSPEVFKLAASAPVLRSYQIEQI
jgi:hypothetical protein